MFSSLVRHRHKIRFVRFFQNLSIERSPIDEEQDKAFERRARGVRACDEALEVAPEQVQLEHAAGTAHVDASEAAVETERLAERDHSGR